MSNGETGSEISGYKFPHANPMYSQSYLMPVVLSSLENHFSSGQPKKTFDLDCGSGAVAAELSKHGYDATGVDPSTDGISQANATYPELKLHSGSAYDDLASLYGQFPAVISLEVVEHVYDPLTYIKTLFSLVEPGGLAIVSTPYHGYLKNVVIAMTGKFDRHVNPMWLHGHIKFWSVATLSRLIHGAGFDATQFHRVGRFPALAKSMIAVAQRPHI